MHVKSELNVGVSFQYLFDHCSVPIIHPDSKKWRKWREDLSPEWKMWNQGLKIILTLLDKLILN
jgi:hypothetical protein